MLRPLVITAAVLLLLGGCSQQAAQAPAAAPAAQPAAAAAPAAPVAPAQAAAPAPTQAPAAATPAPLAGIAAAVAPAPAQAKPAAAVAMPAGQSVDMFGGKPAGATPPNHNRGKVVQTANGGGYTYAEVQMASGQKVWIAGSAIDVKPGTEVEWGNASLMRGFSSKTLGRTFDEILFVDRWNPAGQAPVAVAPHGSLPGGGAAAPASADAMAAAAAGASPAAAADPSTRGTVKSVTNAGGYSYIEVDQGGKTVWVAAMETAMKKGDQVQWQGATQMSNFNAKSLGRTFERIIFAQSVAVGK